MRVLLVVPHFPPRYSAGVEVLTARLASWLAARGHAPEVVCVEHVGAPGQARFQAWTDTAAGFPVHRLGIAPASFARTYHDPEVANWIAERLRASRCDVVHLHSGYWLGGSTLAAAREASVPAVVTLHDFWFICARITMQHPGGRPCTGPSSDAKCAWCLGADRRPLRLADQLTRGGFSALMSQALRLPGLSRWLPTHVTPAEAASRRRALVAGLRSAGLVAAPTEFLAREVERWTGHAVPIRVVRLGMDQPASPAPRTRESHEGLRLLFLGQIAPHKGVHVLLRAVGRLKQRAIDLKIVGDLGRNPDYVALLQRLADSDPRVHLAGAVPNEHVGRLLGESDLLVVPSLWRENYPTVILEAHAHGVPVIASRIGGIPEMIRDGVDGLLVQAGSCAELSRALVRCLEDPSFLAHLTSGVRPPRTLDEEGEAWLAIYDEVRGKPDVRMSAGPPGV